MENEDTKDSRVARTFLCAEVHCHAILTAQLESVLPGWAIKKSEEQNSSGTRWEWAVFLDVRGACLAEGQKNNKAVVAHTVYDRFTISRATKMVEPVFDDL